MNKRGNSEYKCTNRQTTKPGGRDKMPTNYIHDEFYTFKNEYYDALRDEYMEDLIDNFDADDDDNNETY